ncbi:hypothetical protein [Microbacterium sp. NPDC087665]|uniref:hypothetical protein n=1 Tax=Microbacterium sp. NPDC087665 TaxID=3364194 RepID=UPI0038140852
MEWIANPTVGDWLRERIDPEFGTMHGVVPRGFEAYARVFHPGFVRSAPEGADAEQTDVSITWADTAAAFGTTMHPLAQWQRIVRTPIDGDWRERTAPDGREFSAPTEGELDPDLFPALARVLADHTSTPDAGYAGLWDGWGALVGHLGQAPSQVSLTFDSDPNHQAMLQRSIRDPFNNVFRKPTWQEGILSREISEGPRLELPSRSYVLFSAAPRGFADPEWILDAPWRDRPAEEHGFPPSAQSPGILWPEDRAWVVVSEIDDDSTIVGGSAALVAAICADPILEAHPIPEDSYLTWDSDEVNR